MNHPSTCVDAQAIHAQLEALFRQEPRRVLATLIRLLGHFELAEEALQDAFIAAANVPGALVGSVKSGQYAPSICSADPARQEMTYYRKHSSTAQHPTADPEPDRTMERRHSRQGPGPDHELLRP